MSCSFLNVLVNESPQTRRGLASHERAWNQVRLLPGVLRDEPLPEDDVQWGLAATSHAFTKRHTDTKGLPTGIGQQAGLKAWWLASPISPDTGRLDTIGAYLDRDSPGGVLQVTDKLAGVHWQWEVVLLGPGSWL